MSDEDELVTAIGWLEGGRRVALATVVRTWGSSPRPAGSVLSIRDDGLFVGSVSGGCVEGRVVEAALEGGPPRLLEFGVSDEAAWGVGLACGGTVQIRVAEADAAVLRTLCARRGARQPVVLLTDLGSGAQEVVARGEAHALADAVGAALGTDRAEVVGGWFVSPYNPPLRLVIVGAVHIAQPLVAIAGIAGWDVRVVDPRSSFARPERFPGLQVVDEWPDDGLRAVGLDPRTAVVTLTHDPKLDDPALEAALRSEAFYVGALGSARTHEARRKRLVDRGLDERQLSRLRAPVGLALGARTPAEIAVSIVAQIVRDLRTEPTADR